MDDAAIKIERMCTRRCPRLCDVGRGNVGREVGRGAWGGKRNIGLHNLFRLYIDGGKSDASRALYLFETFEGISGTVEKMVGKMGRLGSEGN